MPSEFWDDLKAKLKAWHQTNVDAAIAALFHSLHLSGGSEARGRLIRRKVADDVHRKWGVACGVHNLKPTPEDVSRFVNETYASSLDIPPKPDGGMMNWRQLDLVFQGVARVLIARGDIQFGPGPLQDGR